MDRATLATSIATLLARRTPGRGHLDCDALNPCPSCRRDRERFRELRIPLQRQK